MLHLYCRGTGILLTMWKSWSGTALETLVYHGLRVHNEIARKHRSIAYYRTPAGTAHGTRPGCGAAEIGGVNLISLVSPSTLGAGGPRTGPDLATAAGHGADGAISPTCGDNRNHTGTSGSPIAHHPL